MENQIQVFCKKCNEITPANTKRVNHILHLLLSVFTGGLWLIVWAFLIIFSSNKATCIICGKKNRVK